MYFKLIVVFSLCASVEVLSEQCTTPNNETAKCISLYSCPLLLTAIVNKQGTSAEFARKSNCGGTLSEPFVCCGSSSDFVVPEKGDSVTEERNKLIPDRRYCGLQHSDDYFHTTDGAIITEFPWLAHLRHEDKGTGEDVGFRCSGSLINTRYVLTAAHCLITPFSTVSGVRLGEYHINNETDCTEDGQVRECSTVEEFGIEKLIPHPNYHSVKHINDIALIRLNRTVEYSDYIRPICLPLPGTVLANLGDILTSSGWGVKYSDGHKSEIKKKSLTRLISNEECASNYSAVSKTEVIERHLCTVSLENSTDTECQGDSGGPVIFSHRAQWHQEGIISYGWICGSPFPGVQTRVVSFLDWIIENVKP